MLGGVYNIKNEKGAAASPLAAAQSPAAASPHGSESGRRPSSRKSDSGGSKVSYPTFSRDCNILDMRVVEMLMVRQISLGPLKLKELSNPANELYLAVEHANASRTELAILIACKFQYFPKPAWR